MQVHELQGDERLDFSLEIQRELSAAESLEDLILGFLGRARRRLGFEYYVDALTRDLPPGSYRVMNHCAIPDGAMDPDDFRRHHRWPAFEAVAPSAGGAVAAMIGGERPKIIDDLDIRSDPVFGDELAKFRSGLVVPLYNDGVLDEWVILLTTGDVSRDADEIRAIVEICNMLSQVLVMRDLAERVDRLNAQLRGKIDELGRVQRSILPERLPDWPGCSLAVRYEPSDVAGGDYYDFNDFDGDSVGVMIADVSGHGPAASVVMAMMRTVMGVYRAYRRPAETVVDDVNTMLMDTLREGTFVTAFFLSIDPRTGDCRYANCGHNPPRVRRTDGRVEALDADASMPLGILADMEARGGSATLEPGDTVLLYTDGIVEAFDGAGEMFGVHRLDEVLARTGGDAQAVVDAIDDAVIGHAGAGASRDDRCILAIRYDGV
jgi:sigma-B regulation protein RsbU (phosphoserine phosphatase)